MSARYIKTAMTLIGLAVIGTLSTVTAQAASGTGSVILIQSGDIHGHLMPRANLRSDAIGHSTEGGVARMYTKIQEIRAGAVDADGLDHSLLINTGDTVQGSGEALFSRGQAMIDVLNNFGYVAHAPGNWDFLYGVTRFEETFKGINGNPPLANWGALAANLYYTNQFDDTAICGPTGKDSVGKVRPLKRVLPTYTTKQIGGVKVGILGMTTARAIAAVGTSVTLNYMFTDAKQEVPCLVTKLRKDEKVDVVVMISELEMARDIQIAETISPAPDVILNSDMHERTIDPIVVKNSDGTLKTLILEEGQDGTVIGQLNLHLQKGAINNWQFKQHIITDSISEDPAIAAKVAEVRAPFVTGTFVENQTVTVGGNTTMLMRPVDEVIAYTQVGLHRSNFVDEDMPGVVEGTSHDLIADAMAIIGNAEGASIRGFRYGTHVPAGGAITMEDIYHYIPIASKLGRTNRACGADLKFAIENSIGGTFHPDPAQWTGGWMFGYNGLTYDVDGCDGFTGSTPINPAQLTFANRATFKWSTNRGSNIKVGGNPIDEYQIYDGRALINGVKNLTYQMCLSGDGKNTPHEGYTVTGYWYADDPSTINNCNPCRGRTIQVVMNDGSIVQVAGPDAPTSLPNSVDVMDVSEAVVKYLRGNLNGVVTADNLPIHRLKVIRLPTINPYPFKMIQPLKGASSATCPSL